MVEKLSAVAPDLQTKLKVLIAVAKEHNINWDPTLFEDTESKVSDDLLKGPVKFEEKQNVRDDFSQLNRRYTLGTHNITSTDTNPSGMASEMMNRRHSFHHNSNNNSSSGKETNWDMGFKDATSAAQAAAKSAERASMAARAAAQLSSQGKHSSQSHQSPKASNLHEFLKSGSPFAPPESFFNDDEYADSDEEAPPVPKPTSAGLSRRTKDHVKPKGKIVISNSTETRRSGMQQDRDMNPESPLNSRSKQETSEANQGDKISEQQPSPRKKIVGSGEMRDRKTSDLRSERLVEENDVKKPSHVHPKLPEYDSLAARIQSLRANRQ